MLEMWKDDKGETKMSGVDGLKEDSTKRFECFGDANSSDTCMMCPDNSECAELTCLKAKTLAGLKGLLDKAKSRGRTAFVTHIDGQKLCGKGYETKIWVQQDIDQISEDVVEFFKDKAVVDRKQLKEQIAELEIFNVL